ncbi:DUF2189 domain-containing protein [Niveispirillum sp. SYP-B3756]|uniref:DUF2189 domain-containing protein n=1 Tax=Niveispirillum sp. SYP-B3756 TaxID=2662178 RepID=UPI0012917002|nr:DUF2189 domain-containing protein [Niveispirillum sp. SYP-B3756]MQP67527.1 DUF2189 domain-containing protein [Niveispirillum sp. SYP-B3756]
MVAFHEGERILPLPADYVPVPTARRLTNHDLQEALADGWADFKAAPAYGLAFGGIYALLGLGGLLALTMADQPHLMFPAITGFLLFGPFAALGLYEISRRRQLGRPVEPLKVFFAFRRHGGSQIGMLGLFLVFATIAWLKIATLIYALYFGPAPMEVAQLWAAVTGSFAGLRFAATGIIAGGLIATTIFALSVFSVPMLLDRDVDVVTAILASLRAVLLNLPLMLAWGAMVAVVIGFSIAAGLLALIITLPWLGHATWHLYVRALGRTPVPGAE